MRIQMKSTVFALAAAIAAITATGVASAQQYSLNWNPRSGDVWVDSQLEDVNRYGSRYREPFVNEMVRYYGAPRDLVNELLGQRNWAPGDVYYACSIAQVLGRPCRYVVQEWDRDHGQGWGNVAKRLGIKPGSPEFHRLKRGFVPTYDRWARPIRIDDDLAREFPNRERGPRMRADGPGNSANAGNRGNAAVGNGRGASGKPVAGPRAVTASDKGKGKGQGSDNGKGQSGDKGKGKPDDKGGKGGGKG